MKFYTISERLPAEGPTDSVTHLLRERFWIRQEYPTNWGGQQCMEKSPVLPLNG